MVKGHQSGCGLQGTVSFKFLLKGQSKMLFVLNKHFLFLFQVVILFVSFVVSMYYR